MTTWQKGTKHAATPLHLDSLTDFGTIEMFYLLIYLHLSDKLKGGISVSMSQSNLCILYKLKILPFTTVNDIKNCSAYYKSLHYVCEMLR